MALVLNSSSITGLASSGGFSSRQTGEVLQVVQGTYNTYTSSSSTSYIDSGLSVSITPTSSSSKILVKVSQFLMIAGGNQGQDCYLNIVRNSTQIWETLSQAINVYDQGGSGVEVGTFICLNYLDSPSTTSAITYKTQVKKGTGSEIRWRAGTIIAMEVAA